MNEEWHKQIYVLLKQCTQSYLKFDLIPKKTFVTDCEK